MKGYMILVILIMASTLHAARGVAETRRIMKENAYAGVWEERHGDEALRIAFATNAWAILDYAMYRQHFRWKSGGDGKILLFYDEKQDKPAAQMRYLPDQDIMDMSFEGKTTRLGFTGLLPFKSAALYPTLEEYLAAATAKPPTREARFEELRKSGNGRVKQVVDFKALVSTNLLMTGSDRIETVDLEYPRVVMSGWIDGKVLYLEVYYGAHEREKLAAHELYNRAMRCERRGAMPSDSNEIGIPRTQAQKALEELMAAGVEMEMYYCEYSAEGKPWHEEVIGGFVLPKDRDKVTEVITRHFIDNRPRWVLIEKGKLTAKDKPKENASADAGAK